jgi:hypothetical protein
MKKFAIASMTGPAFSCGVAWLAGFEFDQRGSIAAAIAIGSAAVAFMVYVILDIAGVRS